MPEPFLILPKGTFDYSRKPITQRGSFRFTKGKGKVKPKHPIGFAPAKEQK